MTMKKPSNFERRAAICYLIVIAEIFVGMVILDYHLMYCLIFGS